MNERLVKLSFWLVWTVKSHTLNEERVRFILLMLTSIEFVILFKQVRCVGVCLCFFLATLITVATVFSVSVELPFRLMSVCAYFGCLTFPI